MWDAQEELLVAEDDGLDDRHDARDDVRGDDCDDDKLEDLDRAPHALEVPCREREGEGREEELRARWDASQRRAQATKALQHSMSCSLAQGSEHSEGEGTRLDEVGLDEGRGEQGPRCAVDLARDEDEPGEDE